MAFETPRQKDDGTANRMLVTVAAEVLLVCSVILLLFVYLRLPIDISTGASIAILFIGSLFSWRSFFAAQIVLVICLLVSEFVLLQQFGWLLIPSIILDVLVIIGMAKTWQMHEE